MRVYTFAVDVPEQIGIALKEIEREEQKTNFTLDELEKVSRLKRILKQAQVLSKELAK